MVLNYPIIYTYQEIEVKSNDYTPNYGIVYYTASLAYLIEDRTVYNSDGSYRKKINGVLETFDRMCE